MFLPYVAVSGIVSCSTDRSGASGEMASGDDGESRGVCSDASVSDIVVGRYKPETSRMAYCSDLTTDGSIFMAAK